MDASMKIITFSDLDVIAGQVKNMTCASSNYYRVWISYICSNYENMSFYIILHLSLES